MIFSVSSSAADRPTLGSAPAPRPLVSLLPICSLTGAALFLQRLHVGIGDDELDAVESDARHAVDGVAAAAADADHLDAGAHPDLFLELQSELRFASGVIIGVRRVLEVGHSFPLVAQAESACACVMQTSRSAGDQKNSRKRPRSRPAARTNAPAPIPDRPIWPGRLRWA